MKLSSNGSWILVAALLIAGCASDRTHTRSGSEPQDGPPASIPVDLAGLPEPIPHKEDRSQRGNPSSYQVLGRTYHLLPSAVGYEESGRASWYGTKFHGRSTSSGEPFDMFKLTAAHKTLPIPAHVRVTNLDNGKQLVVRVNDRGPFHDSRIIDLSYAAAVRLGYADQGTARVRVEALEPASDYFLQAGAFRQIESADALKHSLATLTNTPTFVVRTADDPPYRVRLGPVQGRSEAERLKRLIIDANLSAPLILGN